MIIELQEEEYDEILSAIIISTFLSLLGVIIGVAILLR